MVPLLGFKQWRYSMTNFYSFKGTVIMISDFSVGQNGKGEGCYKLISVENELESTVNFVVSSGT